MIINHVLIDFDSVQVNSLSLLDDNHFRVKVFLGPYIRKIPIQLAVGMHKLGNYAEYIIAEESGIKTQNYQIVYYLKRLTYTDPTACFYIISRNKGFDSLIEHLCSKDILSCRYESIEDIPCFVKKEEYVEKPAINTIEYEVSSTLKIENQTTQSDILFKNVHEDLISRKGSKPRKIKTLKSTIKARCGKRTSPSIIDSIFQEMITKGFVKINGENVIYSLPEL